MSNIRVIKSGYCPFSDIESDHKMVWIDTTKAFIFGIKNTQNYTKWTPCKLNVNDPCAVKNALIYFSNFITNMAFSIEPLIFTTTTLLLHLPSNKNLNLKKQTLSESMA